MTSERFDWDTLRVFRIVAELSSMSGAAARLNESPPTIARKIDELENRLGAKLLNRSTRGVELTETGKLVLRHAHMMADTAEKLHSQAAAQSEPVEGTITIATGDGIGPYWLAPRIGRFQDQNPRVQVRLIMQEEAADVTSGEADVALHFTEPRSHDIIAHRAGVQHYITYASREYLQRNKMPESIFEYYKHRCLLHSSYVHQVERWAPKVSELRRMIDYAFVSNSGTALIQACAAGDGIAILPSFIAEMDERLVPLDLPEIAPLQFWIVYTERFRRLKHGQLFVNWLRQIFDSDDAAWFREDFIHPRERLNNVHKFQPHVRRDASS